VVPRREGGRIAELTFAVRVTLRNNFAHPRLGCFAADQVADLPDAIAADLIARGYASTDYTLSEAERMRLIFAHIEMLAADEAEASTLRRHFTETGSSTAGVTNPESAGVVARKFVPWARRDLKDDSWEAIAWKTPG
jgi:hypothetical protein